MEFEPIPVPPLSDHLYLTSDEENGFVEITRENALVCRYRKFEQMNHLRIHMAQEALMMFGIDANPMGEYLVERGYSELTREYPEEFVQRNYLEWELNRMSEELDGKGHEVDEGEA